jgi:ferredoxin
MPVVKFIKENKEIEVPSGANLRSEAIKAGINVHQGVNGFGAGINKIVNCHGWGLCGTCRVKIIKGMENTNPMGAIENFRFHNPLPDPFPSLSFIGNEDTMRLSCKVEVLGDMEVETAPTMDLFGENFFS